MLSFKPKIEKPTESVKPKIEKPSESVNLNTVESLSFESILSLAESIKDIKSKSYLKKRIQYLSSTLQLYSNDMEDIGDTYKSKYVKTLVKQLKSLDFTLKPKEFFEQYESFYNDLLDTESEKYILEKSEFDVKMLKVKPVEFFLYNNKALIVTAPVTMMLCRKLKQSTLNTLIDYLKFSPNTNALLLNKAKFCVINKYKFSGNLSNVITYAIDAFFKYKTPYVSLRDVNKEFEHSYMELIVPQSKLRAYSDLFSCATTINIHVLESNR